MKLVGIEFKKNGKIYIFNSNNLELNIEDFVIVDTERGQQFGRVSSINIKDDNLNHSNVIRIADKKDEKQNQKNKKKKKNALNKAEEDNRVDFRELAKQLASIYKTRIELRQVGVRDKAKEISGIGQCGRKICCSSFLNDLDSVGIAQVKNQNLSLNPTKINGLCGRLLCCLKYEDNLYSELRKGLPEVGDKVKYNGVEGTVISLDIPRRKYSMLTDDNTKVEVVVPISKNEGKKRNNN